MVMYSCVEELLLKTGTKPEEVMLMQGSTFHASCPSYLKQFASKVFATSTKSYMQQCTQQQVLYGGFAFTCQADRQ